MQIPPRILSPNLGCPIITSPEDLEAEGFDPVMAEVLALRPEGTPFSPKLSK